MKHRSARLSALGVCIALSCSSLITTSARASNLDDKKAQAQALQGEIDANGEQISMLAERYDGARLRFEEAQQNIDRVSADLAAAQARTHELRLAVADRGAALYVSAGAASPIGWTNVANVNEAGSRSTYSAAASNRDGRLLDQLRASTADLGVAEQRLEVARSKAQGEIDMLAARRNDIEAANARQTQLLSQVQGEIATLIEQEQARRAAEEQARSDAEFRRLRADTGQTRGQVQSVADNGDSSAVGVEPAQIPVPNAPAPSAGAGVAVAYAKAQLGKPYRYAASGPDEFDCSGLTMMAWAQAGVSMPHYSAAQGAMFPRVPNDQLSPGDLVIYYPDQHHVAIYVGDGMTIAATHTGDFVRLQPVFRSGFQYAVRP